MQVVATHLLSHQAWSMKGLNLVVLMLICAWWVRLDVNWVLSYLSFFFSFIVIPSSNHFLLDLVRPFLDLVRSHAASVVFLFAFLTHPAPEFSDVEFGLRFSPFPPYPSSPSLSIPPELFGNYICIWFCDFYHTPKPRHVWIIQRCDIARHQC